MAVTGAATRDLESCPANPCNVVFGEAYSWLKYSRHGANMRVALDTAATRGADAPQRSHVGIGRGIGFWVDLFPAGIGGMLPNWFQREGMQETSSGPAPGL